MSESTAILAFSGLGMHEVMIILLIGVLIFGTAKIPEIARSLGKAIREFKKAGKEVQDQIEEEPGDEDDETPSTQA